MGKLKFIFGPSGSGKTTKIYTDLLERAANNPEKNFLIVVPDQFTMQTQGTLSEMSKNGGILNIDVLSFGRLTHRIMTEVGWKEVPVLDDTGKCLVLQRVAGEISEELPVLGGKLHRQGYIHEVKSVISEFMQYGLSPSDIDKIIEGMKDRGALNAKLGDLKTIYEAFKKYIEGNYITREEKLDILREIMPSSAILPGSVVVFDGFTGFTPIQIKVIEDIISLADETWVSLVLDKDVKIKDCFDMQSLFYLSGKTYKDLVGDHKKGGPELLESEYCAHVFNSERIHFLGENIFRTGAKGFEGEDDGSLVMFEASNISEEVHQAGLLICKQLREDPTLQFRNIAVVTGDLEGYAPYLEREFTRMGIPFFIDRTNSIRLNPMIEGIRGILGLFINKFDAESVFRYLRSGITGIEPDDIDVLEEFVRKSGIKGYQKWSRVFEDKTDIGKEKESDKEKIREKEEKLGRVNSIRESFMSQVSLIFKASDNVAEGWRGVPDKNSKRKVSVFVETLYDFLEGIDSAGTLNRYADDFAASGDLVREKEYRQVYRKVMELLEQVISLMGEDEITLKEFYEILDAGFGEVRIGTIPQTVDKVLIGDIERTRVPSVRLMFFMGANEGNIPKSTDKGGIISDLEREVLRDKGIELAPTPREEMYSQRLYLCMNMTKPKDRLYISWADLDASGKSLRPSYICEMIKRMFPGIKVNIPEKERITDQIVNKSEGLRYLSDELRRYVEMPAYGESLVYTLYSAFEEGETLEKRSRLEDAAFARYQPNKLNELVAKKLYCEEPDEAEGDAEILRSSISQLEAYTSCHYAFFLRYGLGLKETESFEVGNKDTGNVFHEVLELFSLRLKEDKLSWAEFDDEYAKKNVSEILMGITDVYGASVFQNSARARKGIERLEKALVSSILTIRYQIKKGKFMPRGFEVPFRRDFDMKASEGKKRVLRLRGKIDRVDCANEDGTVFVRIVDYKSSGKSLDLNKVFDGRQMQLPMYLSQELSKLRKDGETAVPAGLFYYHVEDPYISAEPGIKDEEIEKQRIKASRLNGYVAKDDRIIGLNDEAIAEGKGDSDVIKVRYKQDGTPDGHSKVLNADDINAVITYTENLAKSLGDEILSGDICVNPIEGESCKYCAYKGSCSYDRKIPGYKARRAEKFKDDEILAAMREKNSGN